MKKRKQERPLTDFFGGSCGMIRKGYFNDNISYKATKSLYRRETLFL
jgi:hypothetical protein